MKKITFLVLLFVMSFTTYAQISSYTFSQATNSYTEITAGTQLGSEAINGEYFVDPSTPLGSTTVQSGVGFPIGFSFTYNSETYDRFSVMTDGWISLGKSSLTPSVEMTSSSSVNPLNSIAIVNGSLLARICAFGNNIAAQPGATLSFETIGIAPSRVLVVQWKNFRKSGATGDLINFQIRLNESSQAVEIVYGTVSTLATSNNNVQVGLRAAPLSALTNYLSRKSATNWNATVAGITAPIGTEFVNFTNLIAPSSGLTFTFTPPACTAPAGLLVSNISNIGATISWEALSSAPSAYEYFVSAVNVAPTSSGVSTNATTASLNTLQSNTNYYVYLRTSCGTDFSAWSYVGAFKTLCDSVTDFVQNFDFFPTGTGILPDCWTRLGTSNNVSNTTGSGVPGTAPNRLTLNISATTTAFAVMPIVSNLQANTNRLRFKANATATGKTLQVGYFTSPMDVSTFVEVGVTPVLPNAFTFDNAEEYTIVPTGIPAGVTQLVFTIPSGTSTTINIDDVKWELNSECIEPSMLSATAITDVAATLGWIGTNAANWQIQYGPVNFQLGTGTILSSVTSNPFTLTGLLPNTAYQYYVKENCTGTSGQSAWSGPHYFKTTCSTATGFSENFGTTVSYSGSNTTLSNCWDKAGVTTRVNLVTLTPITVPPFNNKLSMNAVGSLTGTQSVTYALMPPVSNLASGTHRLRFKGYTSSTNTPLGTVQVGYMTDAFDVGTFVLLTEFQLPQGIANQQQCVYEVSATLPTTSRRLAFKFEGITTATTQIFILLDDVNWEPIPTCNVPTTITLSGIFSNSVTVNWTTPTPAPTEGFEYFVSTSFADPTASTPATGSAAAGSTSALISGLLPSTNYYVWVRSKCSTSDQSIWTDYVTFTTLCTPSAVMTENFDSFATGSANPLPNCWDKLGTIANVYISNGSVSPSTAPNRLLLSANGSETNTTVAIAAMPVFSNLQANTHRLRFKAYNTSGSLRPLEIGYLTEAYNEASYVLLTQFDVPDLAANATEFVYTPGALPANAVRLVFKNSSIPSAVTSIYVDDVYWEPLPSCLEVSNLTVSNIQENSVNVSWTPPTPAPINGYAYYVGTTNLAPTSTTAPTGTVAAGTNTATISGLSNTTAYFVWVRSVCAADNSGWTGPIAFTTACPPVSAFVENFTTVTTPLLPTCWSKILRGGNQLSPFATITTSTTNNSTSPNFTAPNHISIFAQASQPTADIILVSPKLLNVGADTHRLKFHSFYPATVEIGTLNSNDPSTAVFALYQTITLPPGGSLNLVNFDTYGGSDTYIGIRLVPNPDTFPNVILDNIVWEPIPACSEVANITTLPAPTSVTVSWMAGSTAESSWQVAVGPATVTDPNTLTPVPSDLESIVLTNLNPNSPYKVWVRAICGTNIGNWFMATFTTLCAPQNLPYSENFELAATPALPACTSQITSGNGNNWQTQTWNNSGFSSKVLRNPSPPGIAMDSWFFTNAINLVQGQEYVISYKKGTNNGLSSHNMKVTIGTSPTVDAMTTTIVNHIGFAGNATTESTVFTANDSGVYYFGFHGYGGASGTLYVDDILVDVNLSNENFDLALLEYFPNPVKDVLNIGYIDNIDAVQIYTILGQEVYKMSGNNKSLQIDMSAFTSGTYLVKISSGQKVKIIKVIK